ncbi:DUF2971 domain-containing protein [Citrobacter braakii]|uniref:DUF2971 domain-containing protein n=1 Tax=Citrobacter braakii TaxID=57706 RepID=UPI002B24C5A2|nr:DUF2971 domain-containing protein [Citrobacter braakii]MEB2439840.1 DUF2971 domain-containing protein [Citrobacter braakii]
MYLFKYYRPDFFFDKAIRYNELYFSARAQLNDPNDLNIDYRFDNRLKLWDLLLRSECEYSYKYLSHLLDFNDLKIHKGLNRIFKGKRIKAELESLDDLFDIHAKDIREVLYNSLLPIHEINPAIYGNEPDPKKFLVSLCELGIKERLYRKIVPAVYSVSFSSNALDRMMWAHYAAGFSGCVVIYQAQEVISNDSRCFWMKVTDNLFSQHRFDFPVKPIKYNNQAKEVSLLDPESNISELFLTKNKFWKYESEYRMFVPEANVGIGSERNVKGRVNRNIGHVFHHDTSAIKGIIFGPRMSKLEKERIWDVIKPNMENTNSKSCYFFDAELSPSGKVTISKGQRTQHIPEYGLFKSFMSQPQLTAVLTKLGVIK